MFDYRDTTMLLSVTMNIVSILTKKQVKERLTDLEFAARLGIHRVSWQRIKHRHARFGKKFMSGARQAYPDIFLPADVRNSNIAKPITSGLIEKAASMFHIGRSR